MLKTYFDITENNEKYFINREIYKCDKKYLIEMNRYPVISISLKNITGKNNIEMISQFKEYISSIFLSCKKQLYNLLDTDDKKIFDKYIDKTIEDDLFSNSFYDLSKILNEYYNKGVVIIIDEYDAPLEIALDEGYYEKVHIFFKNLFSKTLKGNEYLKYGIIFGVMEVTKGSLFSGLNNLYVNSLISNSGNEFFGFSYDDTIHLLSLFNKKEMIEEVERWYGGYLFSNIKIFNPWSILNFIKMNFSFDPYWTNTSTNSLIGNLIQNNSSEILLFLPKLLNGDNIVKNINLNLNYSDINNSSETLFSFLVASGYLSIVDKISLGNYALKIPNQEIIELFRKEIIDRFQMKNELLDISYLLKKAIFNNDTQEMKIVFEKYLLSSLSYYDFSIEKNYQIFLLTIISLLFNEYIIESETNSGSGRTDILIESKNNSLGIVIEIKHSKTRLSTERFDNLAISALKQIEEKEYTLNKNISRQNHIIIYGIAFYKNKVNIKSKIIK